VGLPLGRQIHVLRGGGEGGGRGGGRDVEVRGDRKGSGRRGYRYQRGAKSRSI
jgi:hypothetical protein